MARRAAGALKPAGPSLSKDGGIRQAWIMRIAVEAVAGFDHAHDALLLAHGNWKAGVHAFDEIRCPLRVFLAVVSVVLLTIAVLVFDLKNNHRPSIACKKWSHLFHRT